MNARQLLQHTHAYSVLALAATLLCSSITLADATIHGYVIGHDAKGENSKLLANAKVELMGPGGITLASLNADDNGYYAADGLPPGTYAYEVTAAGYSDHGDGRSIELKAGGGVHVLNFFLSQDSESTIEEGVVRGNVTYAINGSPQPLHGATIGLRHDDGTVKAIYTDEAGDFEATLKTGAWRVSASTLGFETQFSPSPITVTEGSDDTVDFNFASQTTTVESTSEVHALVSVQKVNAPDVKQLPEVTFMSQDGAAETPIAGEVRPLTDAELADLGMASSGSWLWFEAKPSEPVPVGSLHVEARLEPFDPATSDTKPVDPVVSTYFDVVLRHKTAEELNDDDDPNEIDPTKVAIHGHLIGQDKDGNTVGLVPGAMVEFLDSSGVVVGSDKTNDKGYYFVHSLAPGEYQYRLTHRRYNNDDVGRGFSLSADTGLHVLNFFLAQGEETVEIGTLVGTATDESKAAVPGSSVIVWNAEDPTSRKILSLNGREDFSTTLADGTWLATATAPGYTCLPVAVTISAGKEAKAELILKKKEGPGANSSIEALVAVQRFDHKSGATGTPTIKFVRASDEQFVAATVRKLTGDEAEAIGASSGSWEYFIANPASSLSAAEYFVTGEMEDYHPAKSGSQYVDPLSVVSFHVTMRSTKADEPDTRPLLVGGHVKHIVKGKEIPVPNATVSLHNGATGTTVELPTGTDGRYYDYNITQGEWWVTAVADGFLPYLHPEPIQVAPTRKDGKVTYGTLIDDIFLKKLDSEASEHQTYAIVAIEKAEASEVAGTPTVQFVNVATKQKVAGKLESIDDEIENAGASSWVWYDAVPVSPLAAGKYRVTGELENFRSDISKERPVADDLTTTFNVTLRSKKIAAQPGLLVATVWRHQEAAKGGEMLVRSGPSEQLAYDATVVFRNAESGQIIYAKVDEDGNYAAELPAGRWQASAKVEGLEPAITPTPIRVFEGKQSFCKLVINVPAPKPVELPKVYAFVGVERPSGNAPGATTPNVQFVPSGLHDDHGFEHGTRYRLFLYKDFNGPERLQDSTKITEELPSWTSGSGEGVPGGIGRVDVSSPGVQAAAMRAVALLNRKEQTNYVLDQVLFCGSQALPGENHHLIVELSEAGGDVGGWSGAIAAVSQPVSANILTQFNLRLSDLPRGFQWYLATPQRALRPGVYHAAATLNSYADVRSDDKAAMEGRTTTFDLMMEMQRPEVEILVYSASKKTPIPGVTAKLMNLDLGRSLSDAIEVKMDGSGRGTSTLRDGMGTYNIMILGGNPKIEPQGKQVVINQLKMTIPFNVKRPDDPIVFTGTVVKHSHSTQTQMKTETRTRTVQKVIDGVTRTIVEEYTVNVPVAGGQDTEQPVVGARIVLMPADDATIAPSIRTPIMSASGGAFERKDVPQGRYRVSVTAKDCLPYNGFVTLDQKNTTAKFVLEACNKELEEYLVKLLTEGWGRSSRHLAAARKYYDLAKRSDPQSPSVDYAMGLVMIQAHRWTDGAEYMSAATRMQQVDGAWSRAAEALVWLSMYRDQVGTSVSTMQRLGTRVYPQHDCSEEAMETAYVMGISAGVLQGPWQKKHPQSGIDDVDAAILDTLPMPLLGEYRRGRSEILDRYQQAANEHAQRVAQAQAEAEATRTRERQRITDALARVDNELKQISSTLGRETAQGQAICAQYQTELQQNGPIIRRLEVAMNELYRQQRDYKTRLAQIVNEIRNFREEGGGGQGGGFGGNGQGEGFGGGQGGGFGGGGQGGGFGGGQGGAFGGQTFLTRKELAQVGGGLEQLQNEEQRLSAELVKISRSIRQLEPQHSRLSQSLANAKRICDNAERQFRILQQRLLNDQRRLGDERKDLERQLQKLDLKYRPEEVKDASADFLTYRKYSINDRRSELLQQVQNGCNVNEKPLVPLGPDLKPVYR